MNQSWLTLTVG